MDFKLPESNDLEIQYFGHLFDNTSECYKMFWFQVIVEKILAGQTSATFEEIIWDEETDVATGTDEGMPKTNGAAKFIRMQEARMWNGVIRF